MDNQQTSQDFQDQPDNNQPENQGNHQPQQSDISVSQDNSADSLNFSSPTPKVELSEPFSWQAVDGIEYSRGTIWYVIFGIVIAGLMALAIFVFKSITFAILLPIMAVATVTLIKHGTSLVNYSVSPKGIYVGDKLYDYSEFRAFGVIQKQDTQSIILLPVKRFGMAVTIYFNREDGEKIVDLIGARLPMQDIKPDPLEKLIHWTKL